MLVTRKDVEDYWKRYCERHQLSNDILAEGLRQVSVNHEYWADHTMQELQDLVLRRLQRN
jgi:hypothetical protein